MKYQPNAKKKKPGSFILSLNIQRGGFPSHYHAGALLIQLLLSTQYRSRILDWQSTCLLIACILG